MRVVEVAVTMGGEISRSGKQVEYVTVGTVTSMWPASSALVGGSTVTMSGTGFMAGRTVCKFGSAPVIVADVMSTTEALCVAPAAIRGTVSIDIATSYEGQELTTSEMSGSDKHFMYTATVNTLNTSPATAAVAGGSVINVIANGFENGVVAYCKLGLITFESTMADSRSIQCRTPAQNRVGNMTLELSANGQDFYTTNAVVELVNALNVSSVSQRTVIIGNVVSVTGAGFAEPRGVYCAIGGSGVDGPAWSYMPTTVVSTSEVSCMVPARGAGFRAIEVALTKGGVMSSTGMQLEYTSTSVVTSVWPASGSIAGGTVVTLNGIGFVSGRTACKFGSATAADAVVLSSTEAICVTPAGARGSVDVSAIANTGSDELTQSLQQFYYESAVDFTSVSPTIGSVEGSTMLSVDANGLEDGTLAWCKIGDVVIASTKSVAGIVECASVAAHEGNHTIAISANGLDFSPAYGQIELVNVMNVTHMSQTSVASGSIVSLFGMGFSASRGVYCALDGSSVDGASWQYIASTIVSSTQVNCMVPARGSGMRVVEVAHTNGGEISRSGKQVQYMAAADVTSVWPASGSVAGGSIVTLMGSNFVAGRTACKFGTVTADAAVRSSTVAVCTTPAAIDGVVTVEVATSYEGQELTNGEGSTSGKTFMVSNAATVSAISPSVVNAEGGSMVSVATMHFEAKAAAWCRLDNIVVKTTSSQDAVMCEMPAGVNGNVTVEVSSNGVDFVGVFYADRTIMNVSAVSRPTVVPGSIVSITGVGFSMGSTYCTLGGSTMDAASWSYVAAIVTSSTTASCVMPARGFGMRTIEVSMSKEGAVTDSGIQVEYVVAGTVTAVSPASGIVTGGTVVTLSGSNFVAGRTACKFGSSMTIEAAVLSSTVALCVAPAGARGTVDVEVETSSVVKHAPMQFMYNGGVVLDSLTPIVGSVEGGSVLQVVTNGIRDGSNAWCKFGEVTVTARSVYDGVVECSTAAGIIGNSTVEVSVNGQDFTSGSAIFHEFVTMMNVTYVSQIPVVPGTIVNLHGFHFSAARGVFYHRKLCHACQLCWHARHRGCNQQVR